MAEIAIFKRATRLPVFSLQESTLFFSTAVLCNNNELLSLILKCVFKDDYCEKLKIKKGGPYKNVEAKANELLSRMPEIGKFKAMILELLWPVTYRIIRWKHVYASDIDDEFLQCFHWTRQGRIDSKKTAKYVIENNLIPILKRFMLACSLCLSDEIHKLYEDMSIYDKMDLLKIVTGTEAIHWLGYFWFCQLTGKDVPEIFEQAPILAIKIRSIEATKHIFSIILEHDKDYNAANCVVTFLENLRDLPFLEEDESDIGYFIFSQMTEKSQKFFFNSNVLVVLLFLLYFPGQNEFLEVFTDKLDDISETDVENLLCVLFYKLHLDIFKDYDYCKLFIRVWKILGETFKNYLREGWLIEYCFCYLISNYFRFLLTKSPSKKAKKPSKFTNIIRLNFAKWTLLHFFIKNEIVTTASLKKHRDEVVKELHKKIQ